MALDFPANPSEGQTYIAENGVTYTYVCDPVGSTSCGWIANSQAGLDERYVNISGDNMTGDLTLGTDKITLNAADGSITATGDSASLIVNRTIVGSANVVKLQNAGTDVFRVDNDGTTRIGGTLPATPNITLNGDGSITAAGSGQFAGNVLIGGALPNAPNITLNASNGNITAAGQITAGTTTGAVGTKGANLGPDGYVSIMHTSRDSSNCFSIVNTNSQKFACEIKGDGSITAAGGISLGGDSIIETGSLNVYQNSNSSSTPVFNGGWNAGSGRNITSTIYSNGTATFAGPIDAGTPNSATEGGTRVSGVGQVVVNATDPTFKTFISKTLNQEKIVFLGNGSATFAGDVRAEKVITDRDGTQVCFSARGGGAENAAIKADGSATFAGSVDVGTFVIGTSGTRITNSGTIYINGSGNNAVFNANSGNAVINADGSATFAGRIISGSRATPDGGGFSQTYGITAISRYDNSSNASAVFGRNYNSAGRVWCGVNGAGVTTSEISVNGAATFTNTLFNLEADDDTKYTATTDEDGNESRVYNGAVLDVKERLQKTHAALGALKNAAAAAVDFAALKSAIATALADI